MDKQKLHNNHPQALGSGPWLFSHCTSPQEILVLSGSDTSAKMKLQNYFSSQWLQQLQQHYVSFSQCHLV